MKNSIIEHELTIYKGTEQKLAYVKLLKDCTGQGLKACKWVADLTPGDNYLNTDYQMNRSTEMTKEDCDTPESHIEWVHEMSEFKVMSYSDTELRFKFDMHMDNESLLRSGLDELSIEYKLCGVIELRNKKIDNLLN